MNKNSQTLVVVQELRCEYQNNPLGLGIAQPRLSWKLISDERGCLQTAYQIKVWHEQDELWNTGKILSDQSILVPYDGPALASRQRYHWQVRVWDNHDQPSEWSEAAWWEMGLLNTSEWQVDWIAPDWEEDVSQSQPSPMLRRSFVVQSELVSARIYATSLGLYQLRLNGQTVGDAVLTPGWTSYDHQLQYQTYDVTSLVSQGDNALGATLGDGWYRGYMGWDGFRDNYGNRSALLLELHLSYKDGSSEVIRSDADWRASTGPIRLSDIYMGETYDAGLEKMGWDEAGYDDSDWQAVRSISHTKDILVAQTAPLVRRHERLKPQRILRSPKGETIFDFGQNMVGWVQLRVRGPQGTAVTLRHAEVLDQEGNLYTENLRVAKQTTRYILKGSAETDEIFEPHFTFMGFQYVAVEGFPGEPTLDSLTGIVVHSDTPPIGNFECSNPLINQLQHNIVWGQKGNFVDVPTDCPQRDERLGWTGDAQVFIRTACFNMDVATFFTKWLRDLSFDQTPEGKVPFVIPDLLIRNSNDTFGSPGGAAAWGDAAVICPWTIYLCYGDTRILEEQYPSMKGWVDYIHSQADEDYVWRKGFHFGDWLDFRGSSPLLQPPITNAELIATAFFAYSAELVANTAQVLGKAAEAELYYTLSQKVKTAFNAEFVTPEGRVGPNTQTAYVLALQFDLLPEQVRPKAAARLAEEVRKADYHLTTGFVGTPYLCEVLSSYGYTEIAYRLLNQDTYPSWLYPVKKGATTIWERWDGIKPDGTFQDAGMNSFNHYAYGAIGEWLYRVVAGIEVDARKPGYKHILFQPQPGGGLTQVQATLDSPYGLVASKWDLGETGLHLSITVPSNTSATVSLPSGSLDEITESDQPVVSSKGILNAEIKGNSAIIEVGSGKYEFALKSH